MACWVHQPHQLVAVMMVVLVGLEFPRGDSSGGHELRGADCSILSSLPRRIGLLFNFIPLGMEDNMPAANRRCIKQRITW